jgi:hypothetical protein
VVPVLQQALSFLWLFPFLPDVHPPCQQALKEDVTE